MTTTNICVQTEAATCLAHTEAATCLAHGATCLAHIDQNVPSKAAQRPTVSLSLDSLELALA